MNRFRAIIDIAILIALVLLPYWVYLPIIFACIIVVPFYWEAVIFGLLVDRLYGPQSAVASLFAYPFAITAALIVIAFVFIRQRLRLNA